MANVQICDWLKTIIPGGEPVHKIEVDGKSFEICEAAKKEIFDRLEGDIQTVSSQAPPTNRPPFKAPDENPVNQRVNENPFEEGPEEQSQAVQAPIELNEFDDDSIIPEDPRKPFRTPSVRTAQRVIQESTKFEQGTLGSLNAGRARAEAQRRLAERDTEIEGNLKRRLPSDINFNMDNNRR